MYCTFVIYANSSLVAKESGRVLASLSNHERAEIVRHLAQRLLDRREEIQQANNADLIEAEKNGPLFTFGCTFTVSQVSNQSC